MDENLNVSQWYDVSVKKAVTLGYVNRSIWPVFGCLITGIRGVLHSLPGRVQINFTGWRLTEA